MATDFGKLEFSTAFKPLNAFPLDARTYFESYDAALAAARTAVLVNTPNASSIYYVGQILTVVDPNTKQSQAYIITKDNSDVVSLVAMPDKTQVDEAIANKIVSAEDKLTELPLVYNSTYSCYYAEFSPALWTGNYKIKVNFGGANFPSTSNNQVSIMFRLSTVLSEKPWLTAPHFEINTKEYRSFDDPVEEKIIYTTDETTFYTFYNRTSSNTVEFNVNVNTDSITFQPTVNNKKLNSVTENNISEAASKLMYFIIPFEFITKITGVNQSQITDTYIPDISVHLYRAPTNIGNITIRVWNETTE
jgi:hypothetical protein